MLKMWWQYSSGLRWNRLLSGVGHLLIVVVFFIVISSGLVLKISGPFVFVWLAILLMVSEMAENIGRSDTYILIPIQCFLDVPRGKLVQLLVVPEDDNGNVDGTKYRQLMRFLEQAAFSFEKGTVEYVRTKP